MGKSRTIDSFYRTKRGECEVDELVVPEPEDPAVAVHVQPPLLLLEFEQQIHEEQVHQTQTDLEETYILRGGRAIVLLKSIIFEWRYFVQRLILSCTNWNSDSMRRETFYLQLD